MKSPLLRRSATQFCSVSVFVLYILVATIDTKIPAKNPTCVLSLRQLVRLK